jgi:hypothetical protein
MAEDGESKWVINAHKRNGALAEVESSCMNSYFKEYGSLLILLQSDFEDQPLLMFLSRV